MDSIRVSELAKELGMTSKEVIEKFGEIDIFVKSHSNTVTPTQIRKLKEHLGVLPKKSSAKPKAFVVKKAKPAKKISASMKKDELIAFAAENNIAIDPKATKAVIIEAIEAALK